MCFLALGKVCHNAQDGGQSLKWPGAQSIKATTAFFAFALNNSNDLRTSRKNGNYYFKT